MSTRPSIAPDVAAVLTAQIPPRLIKKLDATPELAAGWTWTDTTVTTDKGEVVTLTVSDGVVSGVTCSCLLAPKCLHVAAVIALLEPATAAGTAPAAAIADVPAASIEVSSAVPQVARDAFRITADVLATGAETTGAFAQAELLRSIHACRTNGLHRLATVQTRVLRSVRELRADRPEFDLDVLTADLREALDVAHALSIGEATAALVGSARREYEPAGSLRLRGVFTEAVIARSGYAGAVTYLVDDRGRFYTRADIAPGDAGRAAGAYDAPANIGDAVLPHRELCRSGLFVSEATVSADGRLGAGQRVRAVRASDPASWDHDALTARWSMPFADQLTAIAAHDAITEALRPAGWDLVFVEGTLLGGALIAIADPARPRTGSNDAPESGRSQPAAAPPRGTSSIGGPVRLTTPHDQRVLPVRDNLAVLARSPGLVIRAIGRVRLGAPRQLELLALAPAAGETRLPMLDAWHGRANLHYDRLSLPSRGDTRPFHAPAAPIADDLLAALRRRVERVVQGGAGTLPTHAIAELHQEAAALAERSLRGGADVLRDLAAIAHDASRAMAGTRHAIDRGSFARAWLRAALYEDAARRRLSVASW